MISPARLLKLAEPYGRPTASYEVGAWFERQEHEEMADTPRGFGEQCLSWLRQALCGLSGHDEMLEFGRERISLKCASCGHESSGWDLNEARPAVTARADVRRQRATARPRLISARRIA